MVLGKLEDDTENVIVPGVVAPQLKGLLAGVEDVGQRLVLSTELTLGGGQLLPLVKVGVVWKAVRRRVEGEFEVPLWEAVDGCGPFLGRPALKLPHSQPLDLQTGGVG